MQPLRKRAEALQQSISEAYERLKLDAKSTELLHIDEQLADSQVWSNVERAEALNKQSAALRAQIEPWQTLRAQASDIVELMKIGDSSMVEEFDQQISAM